MCWFRDFHHEVIERLLESGSQVEIRAWCGRAVYGVLVKRHVGKRHPTRWRIWNGKYHRQWEGFLRWDISSMVWIHDGSCMQNFLDTRIQEHLQCMLCLKEIITLVLLQTAEEVHLLTVFLKQLCHQWLFCFNKYNLQKHGLGHYVTVVHLLVATLMRSHPSQCGHKFFDTTTMNAIYISLLPKATSLMWPHFLGT